MTLPSNYLMQVVDQINKRLFARDIKRVNEMSDSLIERNNEIKGTKYDGFILGNCTYWHSQSHNLPNVKRTRTTIAFELTKESQQFQDEQGHLGNHIRRIYQTITQLIEGTSSDKELVDALPNCLHQFLDSNFREHIHTPRMKEEAWTLKGEESKRQYRQYQKILPVIHSYVAMSMM